MILKVVAESIKKKVVDACNQASSEMQTRFGSFFPDWKDKKKKPTILVAENNGEIEAASKDEKNLLKDKIFMKELSNELKDSYGIYEEITDSIIINVGRILKEFPTEQSQNDAVVLNTAHETVERYGGFEPTYLGQDIRWLDEGITEMYAREIARSISPTFQSRYSYSYSDFVEAVEYLSVKRHHI